VICDVLSEYLFAPTNVQKEILNHEGISDSRIFVVGNTIVDAVYQNRNIAEKNSSILRKLDLKPNKYVLVTSHRALNVDIKSSLKKLVKLISRLQKITGLPVVYPIHPRTLAKLKKFNLEIQNVKLIEPVGYLDFLALEINANLIVTDSGGIQEEACILQTPCITIRENTERPETLKIGANKLVGLDISKLKKAINYHNKNGNSWNNPFGDGKTSEKILEVITSNQ
jgi:UDP-N-acetylglucosamine 2-epimerase (non-hydrolysing)